MKAIGYTKSVACAHTHKHARPAIPVQVSTTGAPQCAPMKCYATRVSIGNAYCPSTGVSRVYRLTQTEVKFFDDDSFQPIPLRGCREDHKHAGGWVRPITTSSLAWRLSRDVFHQGNWPIRQWQKRDAVAIQKCPQRILKGDRKYNPWVNAEWIHSAGKYSSCMAWGFTAQRV